MSSRGPPVGAPLPLADADDTAETMYEAYMRLVRDADAKADRNKSPADGGSAAAGSASEEMAALADAKRAAAVVLGDEEEPTADDEESDIDVMSGPSATNGGQEGATKGGQEGATKGVQEGATKGDQEGATKGVQEGATKGGQEGATKGGQESGVDAAKDTVPASPVVDGGAAVGAASQAAPLASSPPLRLQWPCLGCARLIVPAFAHICPECKRSLQWGVGKERGVDVSKCHFY